MDKFLSKMMKYLLNIECDKLLHYIAGMMIASFFAITLNMDVCLVPVIFAGFIKEFIDEWKYGGWDWYDLLATILGGIIIQLFVII